MFNRKLKEELETIKIELRMAKVDIVHQSRMTELGRVRAEDLEKLLDEEREKSKKAEQERDKLKKKVNEVLVCLGPVGGKKQEEPTSADRLYALQREENERDRYRCRTYPDYIGMHGQFGIRWFPGQWI